MDMTLLHRKKLRKSGDMPVQSNFTV